MKTDGGNANCLGSTGIDFVICVRNKTVRNLKLEYVGIFGVLANFETSAYIAILCINISLSQMACQYVP